jgi:hypothetical protein
MFKEPISKNKKPVSVMLIALAASALIALPTVPAAADIYRGCAGFFDLRVVGGSGVDNSRPATKNLDQFEGRGQCKNTAQANTCRVRAKDNVFRCANDLWAVRWNLLGDPNDGKWDGGLPLSCQGRATGAKGVGPFKQNPFGQHFDIKYEIEYAACCEMQPTANLLNLSISVSTVGDKGCGNDKAFGAYREQRTLESNYVADCKSLRKQGMCAVRTD